MSFLIPRLMLRKALKDLEGPYKFKDKDKIKENENEKLKNVKIRKN